MHDQLSGRSPGPWLRTLVSVPTPQRRWLCLPHGGAGASAFAAWAPHVPSGTELVAVQYPGREARWNDPPVRDLATMSAHIVAAVDGLPEMPLVVIGHSLGALAGYEVVQRMLRRGRTAPTLFVASGHEPPHLLRAGDVHRRDDEGMAREILRIGGTDPASLGDADLARHLYDVLREDYRLVETYAPQWVPPMTVAVAAFAGADDPDLGWSDLMAWSRTTDTFLGAQTFAGRHLFEPAAVPSLIAAVAELQAGLTPA